LETWHCPVATSRAAVRGDGRVNDESAGTAMRANAISWACDSGEHALVAATHFVCLWPVATDIAAQANVGFRGNCGSGRRSLGTSKIDPTRKSSMHRNNPDGDGFQLALGAPREAFDRWRGRSMAGPFHYRKCASGRHHFGCLDH